MGEEQNGLPERCSCGSTDFQPVSVRRGPQQPLYMTEFMACSSCGVMYHPIRFRSLLSSSGTPPRHDPQQPPFRPEVDTSDWKPPPAKVWSEEP